jgi:hypothetical protein
VNLQIFARELLKQAGIAGKLIKGGLLAGGGAAAGAAAAHAVGKKREKKVAKQFYWLGRNTGQRK